MERISSPYTERIGMMNKKRNIILPTLMILISTLFIAVMPTEAEGALYEDTIRLHILANSDSEEDQSLKLLVRDELLEKYGEELSGFVSRDDAEEKIKCCIGEIESTAKKIIENEGYDYSVRAELCEEWYDTREYEDFSLPRGYYSSLKIIIGDGEGKNWWCVMFPPLCLEAALEKAPEDTAIKQYSKEEYTLISKSGYNIKFKLLELISDVFSRK